MSTAIFTPLTDRYGHKQPDICEEGLQYVTSSDDKDAAFREFDADVGVVTGGYERDDFVYVELPAGAAGWTTDRICAYAQEQRSSWPNTHRRLGPSVGALPPQAPNTMTKQERLKIVAARDAGHKAVIDSMKVLNAAMKICSAGGPHGDALSGLYYDFVRAFEALLDTHDKLPDYPEH